MGRSFKDNPDKYRNRYHPKKKHHKYHVQDEQEMDDKFLKKINHSSRPLDILDGENQ
jgi:hypothetical protein